MHARGASFLVSAQLLVAATAMLWAALSPPAEGQMMLVPLSNAAEAGLAATALASGARLIERGPLPGALTIRASRSALAEQGLGSDVLVLRPLAAGCSDPGASKGSLS